MKSLTTQDLAAIRRVILTVLDDGCTCDEEKHPWEFHESQFVEDSEVLNEEYATQQRIRFADRVIQLLIDEV
jgi:hypothetical protein